MSRLLKCLEFIKILFRRRVITPNRTSALPFQGCLRTSPSGSYTPHSQGSNPIALTVCETALRINTEILTC